MKALIGRKLGMTQHIDEDGRAIPMTIIQAGPCTVTQSKNNEVDGYSAVQLGFEEHKKPNKAQRGHAKNLKNIPKVLREFRTSESTTPEYGTVLDVSVFDSGEKVQVTAQSKGKGFAGTVKRHNFNTGPKTHGSRNYRKPGSIGSMYPQKIFRGKKMAGQMGTQQVTTKNLTVALVDKELGVIGIVGAVPGPKRAIVTIQEVKS